MPKTTAIKLSRKTLQKISEELNIPEKEVNEELEGPYYPTTFYYVKDVLFRGTLMPYLIYTERDFLKDFASVPPGIETEFVPVTQVKE